MPITKIEADPTAVAEVEGMRLRDLKLVSTRLGRVGKVNWANALAVVALLLLGADAGGWIGMWPYLGTKPSHYEKTVYMAILVGVGAIGLVALIGAGIARHERVESVHDIKTDLDELLTAWQTDNGG